MLSLIWRERAIEDLAEIIDYIADQNWAAAMQLQATLEACAERLPDHPFMYRRGRVPGTREAVVHPNYILVYRVEAGSIEVVNVLHSRRQYP